jgi:hypothetical protein
MQCAGVGGDDDRHSQLEADAVLVYLRMRLAVPAGQPLLNIPGG